RARLTPEEGRMHSRRRSVEPEAVFGQAKSNKGYSRFRRFNNTEPDKVMPDFAIFAVAFNLQKLHRKRKNTGQNPPGVQNRMFFLCLFIVFRPVFRKSVKFNTPDWENRACAA
ncbi:MAG: transposase, partial [Tannerella sp.]|nr:transposase [Tannerella sp.]